VLQGDSLTLNNQISLVSQIHRPLDPHDLTFNERDSGQVSAHIFGPTRRSTLTGKLIGIVASPLQGTEQLLRKHLSFGKKYE
jgi:hypothetical protein